MEKLRAFWKYDLFPYVLSGEIVRMTEKGYVETKEYGNGYFYNPIKIYPNEVGIEIQDKLQKLEYEYDQKKNKLLEEYRLKIIDIAPFMEDILK